MGYVEAPNACFVWLVDVCQSLWAFGSEQAARDLLAEHGESYLRRTTIPEPPDWAKSYVWSLHLGVKEPKRNNDLEGHVIDFYFTL